MDLIPYKSIPTFRIIRGDDLALNFDPLHGSVELINALAVRYPLEPNLESQMRRALIEFIATEGQTELASSHSSPPASVENYAVPRTTIPPRRYSSSGSPELNIPHQRQAKGKSRYTVKKRRKVAEVRKRGACEYHRKKKLEV